MGGSHSGGRMRAMHRVDVREPHSVSRREARVEVLLTAERTRAAVRRCARPRRRAVRLPRGARGGSVGRASHVRGDHGDVLARCRHGRVARAGLEHGRGRGPCGMRLPRRMLDRCHAGAADDEPRSDGGRGLEGETGADRSAASAEEGGERAWNRHERK